MQTEQLEETNIHIEDEWAVAEIHLENIWQRTNLPRIDDVLTSLRELQLKKVLSIIRIIEFEKSLFFDHRGTMLKCLNLVLAA